MRSLGIILCLTAVFGAILATAQTADALRWKVQPANESRFELIVRKTGVMSGKEHLFVFPRFQGELNFNESAPERSSMTLQIDAASIECKDDWVSEKDRVKVLREATDKMLRVNEHKQLVFRSTSMEKQAEGMYAVRGNLEIRGVAKPVVVQVKMQRGDGGTLRFTGDSTIDMTAWGLKPPSALLGAIGTDKNMQVRFALSATR